jgi:hypothetical protein
MNAGTFAPWLRMALVASLLCACTSENRISGVISTGNAGRVKVQLVPRDRDSAITGELRFVERTDSIAEIHTKCKVRLDSSCADTLPNGSYRAEVWISNRLSGRTGWFDVNGASLDVSLPISKPETIDLSIPPGVRIDSILLGSRGNVASFTGGTWQVTTLVDSSDVLWIKIVGGSAWLRYSQTYQGSNVVITPVSTGAPVVTPSRTLVLGPGNSNWFETTLIGGLPGTTSSHDDLVYSLDTTRGLGAAWDASTIGRTLWRIVLPDSLRSKTILSAKLVYHPSSWGIRPDSAIDYRLEAHRMLRAWKVGTAGYGTANTSAIDGATANEASWGVAWSTKLVGLDGTDADSSIAASDTLAAKSLDPMEFDITSSIKGWLSAPATNFGLVLRSPLDAQSTFPDYPVFWSNTARDTANRPRLLLEIAP